MSAALGEIAESLEAVPPEIKRQVAEAKLAAEKWRREWKESMDRHRREEQAKRRNEAIDASRAELLAIIEEWNESKRVVAFFQEVLAQLEAGPEEMRAEITGKLAAARQLFGGEDTVARLAQWRAPD